MGQRLLVVALAELDILAVAAGRADLVEHGNQHILVLGCELARRDQLLGELGVVLVALGLRLRRLIRLDRGELLLELGVFGLQPGLFFRCHMVLLVGGLSG